MDNNKRVYLIIGVITITMLVMGVTTAWFTWRSSINTDVTFNVNGIDIINTNVDIVGKELYPTNNKDNGIVEEFTVKQNNEISTPVCSDFILTLTTLPIELQHKSFKYKLYNGTNLVGSGNFEGKMQGQVITIATSQPITGNISTYKLYIWIDGTMDNPLSMGGKSFLFKLTIKANQQENTCTPSILLDASGASEPVLASGMIPVKYDGANSKWVKASTTQTGDWYDYDVKKWANAVMVTSDTRDSYMSDTTKPVGSEVLESDILAYYVWIPRYSYQLFNVNSQSMDPIEIKVEFEGKDTTKSTGSTNGDWLTHPAFTFGNDELNGIWVGKFETSLDENDVCYTDPSVDNCNKVISNPTIKAGVYPLVYQNVLNQFLTSKEFGTTNYLTSNGVSRVDAHMMKSIEWGAVAYLKQSKYGLGLIDIRNNEYKASAPHFLITGCGAISADTISHGDVCNNYKTTLGMMSSATGNVYGIYDMAGGGTDVVMAVMSDNTENKAPMSGGSADKNSGFSGKVYASGNYDDYLGVSFPDKKYYDLYTFGTTTRDQAAFDRRIIGDATGETHGWYNDASIGTKPLTPWLTLGGLPTGGPYSGIFYFNNSYGTADNATVFRSVLVAK